MLMTVVLPTYNEAENLPRMAAALLEFNLPTSVQLDLLIVDDASPDGTGRIADELATQHPQRVRVLHRKSKEGLGRAYLAGFAKALERDPDLLLQMDCDFSHQPRYIADMLALLPEADMVLGSRFCPGGGVDASWARWRKLLSWFANRVYVRAMLGLDVWDATGGFRLWRSQALRRMNPWERVHSNGYAFQVEMAYLAKRVGLRIRETPIYFPDRTAGQSKMSLRITLEAAWRVAGFRWRYRGQNTGPG